jgi:hypothetical protein
VADYYLLSKQDVATVKAALAFQKNIRGPGVRRTPDGLTIDPPTNGGGISPPDAQPAWLIVRDHASNTTVVAGNKMYYEAKLVTDDTVVSTFLNGTDDFDCLAYAPELTNYVTGAILTFTTADGTTRTGLPLHGAQIEGVPAGNATIGDTGYPVYKIRPRVARTRFNEATKWDEVSYVVWPGLLDDSGDPVGDDTTLDNDQDRLWVRCYESGPCATGTTP